ncbi:ATP synthase F1 subunit delta [Paludibaculum fermentans]|uniref:ATP synthase F1 subunit delta n=1 Tax=Paludibaculum fermentans TaxID=1473598 RepID=UPI003EBA06A5
MSTLAIANQYAKALLESISQPGSGATSEEALTQLEQFDVVLKSSHDLHTVLLSPAVPHAQKQKVLGRIAELLGLHGFVRNFLFVVTRHRRLNLLAEIRERYQALLDEAMGLVRARVSTAVPLTPEQKVALEAALAQVTGKQMRCAYELDDTLVGGLAVRVGSTMYDGSVRGQLDSLRRRLTSEA